MSGKQLPIEVISFIGAAQYLPYEADIKNIHDHAIAAAKIGSTLRLIEVNDHLISVVYIGPLKASDNDIIKSSIDLINLIS